MLRSLLGTVDSNGNVRLSATAIGVPWNLQGIVLSGSSTAPAQCIVNVDNQTVGISYNAANDYATSVGQTLVPAGSVVTLDASGLTSGTTYSAQLLYTNA